MSFSGVCPSYCMLAQIVAQFWHFVAELKETVSQHKQPSVPSLAPQCEEKPQLTGEWTQTM